MRTHTTYERMNTKLTTQSKVKNRFPSITKVVIQYKHVQVEKLGYSPASLTAHSHCFHYPLKQRLWLLGWGQHTALTSLRYADACRELKLCISCCSCFCPGHSLHFTIVIFFFCAIKIKVTSVSPLLRSCGLLHHFHKLLLNPTRVHSVSLVPYLCLKDSLVSVNWLNRQTTVPLKMVRYCQGTWVVDLVFSVWTLFSFLCMFPALL